MKSSNSSSGTFKPFKNLKSLLASRSVELQSLPPPDTNVTRGDQGSWVRTGAERIAIDAVPAENVVDPTGCGDAYRAGLVHGLRRELPMDDCARLGSVMGSLMVQRPGTQSLELLPGAFQERVRSAFGLEL